MKVYIIHTWNAEESVWEISKVFSSYSALKLFLRGITIGDDEVVIDGEIYEFTLSSHDVINAEDLK